MSKAKENLEEALGAFCTQLTGQYPRVVPFFDFMCGNNVHIEGRLDNDGVRVYIALGGGKLYFKPNSETYLVPRFKTLLSCIPTQTQEFHFPFIDALELARKLSEGE